jgi:hypothetical protein
LLVCPTLTLSVTTCLIVAAVVVWETLDHHKKVMSHDSYPALVSLTAPAHAGPLDMLHFEVSEDPTTALTSPVTYFTYFTLNEGKTREGFKSFLDSANIPQHFDVNQKIYYGWCVERSELSIVFLGWASVEVSVYFRRWVLVLTLWIWVGS